MDEMAFGCRLPLAYSEASTYMQDAFQFLAGNKWIYDFQLTRLLLDRVWEDMPLPWRDVLCQLTNEELNQLPFENSELPEFWPSSLMEFLNQAQMLSLPRQQKMVHAPMDLEKEAMRGMNPKKIHEVRHMATLVHGVCNVAQCRAVVDVGSGLGYLGQVLSQQCNLRVVGLESKMSNTKGAKSRHTKQDLTPDKVETVTMEVTNTAESLQEFIDILNSKFGGTDLKATKVCARKCGNCADDMKEKLLNTDVPYIDEGICKFEIDTERKKPNLCSCNTVKSSTYNKNLVTTFGDCDDVSDSVRVVTKGEHSFVNICEQCLIHNGQSTVLPEATSTCSHMAAVCNHASSILCHKEQLPIQNDTNFPNDLEKDTPSNHDKIPATEQLSAAQVPLDKIEKDQRIICRLCSKPRISKTMPNHVRKWDECNHDILCTHCKTEVSLKKEDTSKYENLDKMCTSQTLGATRIQCHPNLSHPVSGICLIGLHSCGSLTPTMLRLFVDCPRLKTLVCVGCCYHSMKLSGDGTCPDFPLSQVAKEAFSHTKKSYSSWNISNFALRLAAQETRARWQNQSEEDHIYHCKNVAYRGLLEILANEEKQDIGKERRKLARKKDFDTFDAYLDAVLGRSNIKETSEATRKLKQLYDEYQDYFKFIEPITAMQVLIQPVLESVLLIDRLLFLQEHGLQASLAPVFDEYISPRNMAIVALK